MCLALGVAHRIPLPPVSALLLIHLRLPDLFWLKLYYSVASQNPIIQINFILLFSRDTCRGTGSIPTVPVCPLAKRVLPDKGDAKRMFNYFRSCFRLSLERCLLSKNGGSIQHWQWWWLLINEFNDTWRYNKSQGQQKMPNIDQRVLWRTNYVPCVDLTTVVATLDRCVFVTECPWNWFIPSTNTTRTTSTRSKHSSNKYLPAGHYSWALYGFPLSHGGWEREWFSQCPFVGM